MYTSKIITTKRIKKNKNTYIGFLIHQIPSYLEESMLEFNHSGFTYVNKWDLKERTLNSISKS